MAWIESHQALSRHRKTLALAALLKTDRHKVLGHLHELWWWGLDNADVNGLLGNVSDRVIAEAAGWTLTNSGAFLAALVEAGFMDVGEDGLTLHDWYEYAGKLNERREENRERMRKKRTTKPPPHDPRTNGASAEHVQRTSGARAPATGPNQPDLTNLTSNTVANATASEPGETSPGDDRVDEIYAHFKARIQPRSRLCPRKRIAARLKRFTVDELKSGIDHFADDHWWMENNGSQGADWFFESDARAEKFMLLKPRPKATNVVPLNGAPKRPIDAPPEVPADSPFLSYRGAS